MHGRPVEGVLADIRTGIGNVRGTERRGLAMAFWPRHRLNADSGEDDVASEGGMTPPTSEISYQWQQVRSLLRAEVGDTAYSTWLKPLDLCAIEGERAVIAVPTQFMRDWVVANYAGPHPLPLGQRESEYPLDRAQHSADEVTPVVTEVARPAPFGRGRVDRPVGRAWCSHRRQIHVRALRRWQAQ